MDTELSLGSEPMDWRYFVGIKYLRREALLSSELLKMPVKSFH